MEVMAIRLEAIAIKMEAIFGRRWLKLNNLIASLLAEPCAWEESGEE